MESVGAVVTVYTQVWRWNEGELINELITLSISGKSVGTMVTVYSQMWRGNEGESINESICESINV